MKITLILLGSICILFIHHFLGYIGHFGYDDIHYAHLASDFLKTNLDTNDHYTYRIIPILWISIFYFIGGINDMSSSLSALSVAIGTLYLVWEMTRRNNIVVGLIALLGLSFSHWNLFYSDKLMPDIYVCFFITFAFYFIWKYRFTNASPTLSAIGFSTALMAAFLSKETVVLSFPTFMYIAFIDIFKYKKKHFWGWSIAFSACLLVAYLIYLKYTTGNIIARFDAISANSYFNECSYDVLPKSVLIQRITKDLLLRFLQDGIIIPFIFILGSLHRFSWKMTAETDFFATISLCLLLSANFMSVSPTAYIPMCADPRHYLFLTPMAAISMGHLWYGYRTKPTKWVLIAAISIVSIGILSQVLNLQNPNSILYIGILFLLGVELLYPLAHRWSSAFWIGIYLIFFFQYLKLNWGNTYTKIRKVTTENIHKYEGQILTNPVFKNFSDYFNQFKPSEKLSYYNFENIWDKEFLNTPSKKYLLRNWYTEFLSGQNESAVLPFLNPAENALFSVFKDEKAGVELFEIKEPFLPKHLLTIENNFEQANSTPYWGIDPSEIRVSALNKKGKSYQIKSKQAFIKISLDSILPDQASILYLRLQANTFATSNDTTTIHLKTAENTSLAKADLVPLYPHVWLPYEHNWAFEISKIKENNTKSLYIYIEKTNNKATMQIDDIKATILYR